MKSKKNKTSEHIDLELNLSDKDIAAFSRRDPPMETGDYLKFLREMDTLFPPDLSRRPGPKGEKFQL